ncbi:MAG: glutathione binding-like protein [Aliiglaciecola sp.]
MELIMIDTLEQFPITQRWETKNPDKLQLYTLHTPNGAKVAITLEELNLDYEVHKVTFDNESQKTPEFISLSPNGKVPAIIDPRGPNGKPIGLFESAAIMMYLADKTGNLLPQEATKRWEVLQWLLLQNTSIGPMFGQFGHFYKVMAGELKDTYSLNRYGNEVRRLFGVLDHQLSGQEWLAANQFSIADIAVAPWIWTMKEIYRGEDVIQVADFKNVERWYAQVIKRPSWSKGLFVAKSNYGYE